MTPPAKPVPEPASAAPELAPVTEQVAKNPVANPMLATATPAATDPGAQNGEPWTFRPGGFIQPQYRLRQDSPAPFDEDGFRFARARLTATGSGRAGNLVLGAYMEAELQPTFSLYDAYVTVSRPLENRGVVAVDFGQTRVPISRQQLLSDTRIAFAEKAQLSSIAPDRDLGIRAWYVPSQLHQLRVIGGVFNGEGRNQVQNINQSYLYAGRVEFTPIGDMAPYAESAFYGTWLTFAACAGRNVLTPGDFHETQISLGGDISGAWHGLSGSFEYLEVRHSFSGDPAKVPGVDYKANGFTAQVNYMLPWTLPPLGEARLEVGARVEEIDRNDQVPIVQIGDPNQSVREYTAVATLYLRQHLWKIQLAASHFDELEDQTATGAGATYPNDQLLLQLTYRVE
ncbi:MAG TPA: porin [Kofleriaceae bacterium]|nr:porin [Kofleriaceae bacterium]